MKDIFRNIIYFFIGITILYVIGKVVIFLGISLYKSVTVKKEEYIKQYSYELKGINNKEYKYENSSASFTSFIIAYGNYTSKTEYEEYYILWQNTEKGLEKIKIENKNVYIIENNEEQPRIEYYKKQQTFKNENKVYVDDDYYYQIYIPENSIDYNYKLN